MIQSVAGAVVAALFLTMTGIAAAQLPAPGAKMAVPDGYKAHQTVDVGGNIVGLSGSGAMYDTLVNTQSGPRVLGESFELRALPGNTHSLVDSLHAFGNGFGGDPNSFARLTFEKGKLYEFSGVFRRDRQYFDYDLLGNPNIPGGQSIAVGPTATPATPLAWPQVLQSPMLFNTVRRMTDTNLTLLPLSKVTFRAGYAQNIFQGPSLSPSGYQFATGDAILEEYQRNSTDDFTGGVDWKPVQGTKLTFEEQITHYKADSYFTLDPSALIAQEADGTPVALNNYDSLTPLVDSCDTFAKGTNPTFTAPQTTGGLPVISPYCSAVTSYSRTQPTRILTPTEEFRLQSTSIRNISMNGDFRYTSAKMNLPNYYDSYQGLSETAVKTGTPAVTTSYYGIRSVTYLGAASAQRKVVAADYGVIWRATSSFSLADQAEFSNVHQPGTADITSGVTLKTPSDTAASSGNAGINALPSSLITVTAATGASTFAGSPAVGTPLPDYFGQRFFTNNLTGSWEVTARTTLSLTYRYGTHTIVQGAATGASSSVITINENGVILNAAFRPTQDWSINGTVEALYADNSFTPVGPRQTRHYRVHTLYRPKPWATVSAAFNDLERHNNTSNTGTSPIDGPLNHVDYSRIGSLSADLAPNEHYGLDFSYAYSDVYTATNICYLNGSPTTGSNTFLPGAVASATATLCPGVYARGSTTVLSSWSARDFTDAPTQYLSAAVNLSPSDKLHSSIGYRISDVNGSRFFSDARDVNGSLVSKYQSPFVSVAWTVRPGWIWKAEYNYFGYGEGGASGSPYCSTATSVAGEASIVPCNSATLTGPTGLTETSAGLTAPRNFHANNLTLGMHYEF
jgi:hypothetical protein